MIQSEALDILKLGHNVYLTGAAGSGKTYVLNQFIKYLRENNIVVGVTASTGIAATHMNGMTIHSWAGIGIYDDMTAYDIDQLLKKSRLKKRFAETKVLIIDEVSMLHGQRLDLINKVCRAFMDKTKPFGGLQVVLCGDLFQLPPITKDKKDVDFVFKSKAWNNMNLQICYLSEQYRQDDQRLLDILSAVRGNEVDEGHFEHLEGRFTSPPGKKNVTKLYTHNAAVDTINREELSNIKGDSKTYYMTSTGNKKLIESLISSCLSPEILELKIGAEVMFVANNVQERYVNGTLGKVIDFSESGAPIVEAGYRTIEVKNHTWSMMDGEKTVAAITQLPLRLAWAITVHKSQGMTLDAAEIDLAKSFEPGMGYVALSRVGDLDGLYIKGLNNTALMVSPDITALDKKLKTKSQNTQSQLKKIPVKQIEESHHRVRQALRPDEDKILDNYDEELFAKLKNWRIKQAKEQSVPAYVVLNDKTLKLISSIKPKTKSELSKIKGIGGQKLEKYAKDVLKLVNK